ncbi:hypothetical protein N7457_006848 [Penicillium paradoxum]|uniref:uncharacterized protein n=1 Tax=Penicillium paradoxum TaxID=176176 RepID=UPI002546B391|nr:uncharacterized protein N7457_006848 [Penicillium paradoxum]KAJ5779128.1 hypothetical protein N7457_006848 [Penicillium paradoxum]
MFRPVYVLAALSAVIASATAADHVDVVTLPLGPGKATTFVGKVVGYSESLTSYVIEEIPGTIVVGASTYHQTWVYPDGDFMSQGCNLLPSSSIECEVYMSDADSGSTTVSPVPAAMLSTLGPYIVSITATETGARSETTVKTATDSVTPVSPTVEATETTVKTVTDSTTPVSTTAEAIETGKAKSTSEPTGDVSSTSATEGAAGSTSVGAAAHLAMNGSWIGGFFMALLAAF